MTETEIADAALVDAIMQIVEARGVDAAVTAMRNAEDFSEPGGGGCKNLRSRGRTPQGPITREPAGF